LVRAALAVEGSTVALTLEAARATSTSPCALALNQATTEEPISSAIKLGLIKLDIDDIGAGHNGKKRKKEK